MEKQTDGWPNFHLLNRGEMLEAILSLAHLACDQMHYEPERCRGAEAMLAEKLMTEDISGAGHSDLYRVWMEERGTDW